ncbi:hypothetical protein ACIO3O_38145 [Streptomyces sp. NPDC087440]|uniref:hypothetical protein n=1 Tax=Streptomyces sp. NPDC087440 TaxID=3365790 RepID=UPI0037F55CB1
MTRSEARARLAELIAAYGTDGALLLDRQGRPVPLVREPKPRAGDEVGSSLGELSERVAECNRWRRLFDRW